MATKKSVSKSKDAKVKQGKGKVPAKVSSKAKASKSAAREEPDEDELEPEVEPAPEPVAAVAPEPKKARRGKAPVDLAQALVEAWETHERIHQFLLEELAPEAWSSPAPIGKGRTVRGIVCHIHNVRLLWLASHAPEATPPAKLERESATLEQAREALGQSSRAIAAMLRQALAEGGRLKDFKPDVVNFAAYAMAHEAHHRGQICLVARALGQPLSQQAGFGLWEWRKRHGEAHPEPEE
ncbi:MAG: hypothetical protein NTV21_00495 [Planctomycetota bacterium]|nr:hypothetical protein [Planctomycetota bacterium]